MYYPTSHLNRSLGARICRLTASTGARLSLCLVLVACVRSQSWGHGSHEWTHFDAGGLDWIDQGWLDPFHGPDDQTDQTMPVIGVRSRTSNDQYRFQLRGLRTEKGDPANGPFDGAYMGITYPELITAEDYDATWPDVGFPALWIHPTLTSPYDQHVDDGFLHGKIFNHYVFVEVERQADDSYDVLSWGYARIPEPSGLALIALALPWVAVRIRQ